MQESGQVVTVTDPADVLDPGLSLEGCGKHGADLAAVTGDPDSDAVSGQR
jgi:hypothetical protein